MRTFIGKRTLFPPPPSFQLEKANSHSVAMYTIKGKFIKKIFRTLDRQMILNGVFLLIQSGRPIHSGSKWPDSPESGLLKSIDLL